MTHIRTSLDRVLPESAASDDQLRRMAAAAWHRSGKALLDPALIADPWVRQVIVTEAERLYGKRRTG